VRSAQAGPVVCAGPAIGAEACGGGGGGGRTTTAAIAPVKQIVQALFTHALAHTHLDVRLHEPVLPGSGACAIQNTKYKIQNILVTNHSQHREATQHAFRRSIWTLSSGDNYTKVTGMTAESLIQSKERADVHDDPERREFVEPRLHATARPPAMDVTERGCAQHTPRAARWSASVFARACFPAHL
jgi:hypothetical protein